jgi:molecular chaperone HscB
MDPFATLGFPHRYDLDKKLLDQRYRELQQALHPDRHGSSAASQRALTLSKAVTVNEAYRILRDDLKRAEALLIVLSGQPVAQEPADPEMLMEMMEMREALSEARTAREAAQVARLSTAVGEKAAATQRELATLFTAIESESTPAPAKLTAAQTLLGRLRYYRRFQDEVAQFEDEALA